MGDHGDDAGPETIDERGLPGRTRPGRPSARYALSHELGHGGMGEVIAARDEQIGRDVAIKRMKRAQPSDQAIARFLREARIQGRLEHPSIVPVHEIGRDATGQPFFSMKKLAGTTMQHVIAKTPDAEYPRLRLLRAFVDVCNAIELAHTRGVIHRDIKPANIMLGDFGEVYVLDWGVAKVSGEADISAAGEDDGVETKVGSAIGTPAYMAPEQARGVADLDHRADVYSLGCVLFEILSRQPFGSLAGLVAADAETTAVGIPIEHRRPAHRAPDRDIPPELDQLCADATSPDREQRPPSARAMGDAVQRFLDGDRDLAMRKALAQTHLATAQAAFENRHAEDERRIAIREAGRAIALDPKLAAAATLVGRLMIEPPAQTPREVEAAIAEDDHRHYKNHGRIAGLTYLLYALFIPVWLWIAPIENFAVMTTILAVNVVLMIQVARGAIVSAAAMGFGMALLLASIAWTFAPLWIGTALSTLLALIFSLSPRINVPRRAIGAGCLIAAGVVVPWLLERLGAIPSSLTIDARGVLFHAPGLERAQDWMVVLLTLSLVATAVTVGFGVACSARSSRRQLQIQAWQLRQLVGE